MALPKDLRDLARRIKKLRSTLREMGMFDHSRELLACPQCMLTEDVTFEGMLITCGPKEVGVDTELRFIELDEEQGRYKCPACGHVFLL